MQTVLLHAGAGLLQGSMAIYGARAQGASMLVMSGESVGYGEGGFDPGPQWYRNLNVVGGPQRLVEPLVKVALQSTSVDTLYHGVVRAGEIAQRTPRGPTYLCVSMEIDDRRMVEAGSDARRCAAAGVPTFRRRHRACGRGPRQSRSPFILVERAGSDQATFDALVELAEALAIPVIDAPGAGLSNFPKSHDLYLGLDIESVSRGDGFCPARRERSAMVSPSNVPKNAKIVAIGSNPLKDTMVYQVTGAERYLEGDTALTLRLLTEALRGKGSMPPRSPHAVRAGRPSTTSFVNGSMPPSRRRRVNQPSRFRWSRGSCATPRPTPSMWTRRSSMHGWSAST